MKKRRLLAPLLLLTAFVALAKTPACAADSLIADDIGTVIGAFASADNNILILSNFENNYKITIIDSSRSITTIDPETPVFETPYAYDCGRFYFFTNGAEINSGRVMTYVSARCADCATGSLTTRVMNGAQTRLGGRFACSSGRYFLMTDSDIAVYSAKCRLEEELPLDANGYSMATADDGTVYCATSDGVIVIGSEVTRLPIASRNIYPTGSFFSDDASVIYDGSGEVVFDGFDPSRGAAAVGDCFAGRIGGELTAVCGDERTVLGSAGEETFILGCTDMCVCVDQEGECAAVRFYDLGSAAPEEESSSAPEESGAPPEISGSDSVIPSGSGEPAVQPSPSSVASPSLDVTPDRGSGFLTGIGAGLTPAAFRRESAYPDAEFYDISGGRVSSGALATGMKAVLPDGEFTVVITGDITGEGSVNGRDLTAALDHLLGDCISPGAYTAAADMTGDGDIDLRDALALYRRAD